MGTCEASPAQERFWLLDELGAADDATRVLPLCVRLDGALDLDRLAQALRAVLARHEPLRSVYRWEGERLVAEPRPADAVPLTEEGSRAQRTFEDDEAVERARRLAERPLALGAEPPLRALLLANGPWQSYLALAAHHVAWDGWSQGVLLRDLAEAYASGAPELPPLAYCYWDYAARRRRAPAGERAERELAHWRDRLDGVERLPPLAVPLAGEAASPRIERAQLALDRALVAAIGAFAAAQAATPFSVCVAAFQALLERSGLGGDSCLGIALADRFEPGSEALVGCCLNTVALRGSVAPGDTFAQLTGRVREAAWEALANCELPFEAVVRRLGRAPARGGAALYQALVSFLGFPPAAVAIGGAEAVELTVPPPAGETRPVLTVGLDAGAPLLRIDWNGRLALDPEALLDGWRALLEDGVRRPHEPLEALLPLRARSATAPQREEPPPQTLGELLRSRVAACGAAPALLAPDATLTFAELLDETAQMAQRLREAGVAPGNVVGLTAPRSAAGIVATLAIQAAGAACMPLDADHPPERLRAMLRDAGAALVLAARADGRWQGAAVRALDGSGSAPVAADARDVGRGIAWVYYTSGSTGRPKGVLVSHATIVARLLREPEPWREDDRGCHKSSPSYGDSIWEIFAPLVHGCPTVVADEEAGRDPRLLSRLVASAGVTRMLLVPSLLTALLSAAEREPGTLASLRCCIATGETLSGALAERFHRALPDATLLNVYGTTECWEVCWHRVPRGAPAGEPIPIGSRLFEGVRAWVVDDELGPLPADAPGELLVGGHGVARGYLDRPGLTAERFVPLAPLGGEGVGYRTGDLVARSADGTLTLLGRRDRQVKLRGQRIELEEVEGWLAAAPGVAQAAVAPQRDEDGTVVGLTACLVAAAGERLDVARVRGALAEQLPDHALPTAWVQLGRLPLSTSGKLDRGALDQLVACQPTALDGRGAQAQDVAPRDEAEQRLAGIWRELLEVERVGATDDFFALGGSSLLAVQLVMRVEAAFGVELPLRDFYASPTIAGLRASLGR